MNEDDRELVALTRGVAAAIRRHVPDPKRTILLDAPDYVVAESEETTNRIKAGVTHADMLDRLADLVEKQSADISKLSRTLLPVQMTMIQEHLCGNTMSDDAVVLNFMGSGGSDRVTAGEIREALHWKEEDDGQAGGPEDDGVGGQHDGGHGGPDREPDIGTRPEHPDSEENGEDQGKSPPAAGEGLFGEQ